MFPTQSKVNRSSRIWLLPVVALAMLLVGYAVLAASTAQAQLQGTPAGDICVEGIVIDWEENPLAGWQITLTSDISGFMAISTTSAPATENNDVDYGGKKQDKKSQKYNFEYPEVDPDFEKGEFEFSEDDIADAGTGSVQSGIFTATIETMPGWEGVTPTTLTFPIDFGEDGCVKIRFKMRRVVPVTVYKIDANHQPLGDWKIRAVPGPGNLFASPQEETTAISPTMPMTNGAVITPGAAVFTLTPGLWIFTEMAPKQDMDDPQDSYVPVVPPTGRQELLIPDPEDLDDDEAFTLVFKNELVTGCFIVRKNAVVPATDMSPLADGFFVSGWGFKLLRQDGSVARQGVTDGRGQLRFDNLPLGPYVIVEEERPGWTEASLDDMALTGTRRDINVTGNFCDPDLDLVVEFFNEQDDSGFCIEGRKIDANGGYGLADWEIVIEPLADGGADPIDGDTVITNGRGEFRFDFPRNDYRIPGAKYEVCEQEPVDGGWLPHNATCQIVRLPEWPGKCVQLKDFVNQQVGHTESEDHGKAQKDGFNDKGDNRDSGPSYGGNDIRCTSYHVVKSGEGLYDIGSAYKKSPQQMLDANPSVRDGDKLWVYEGQRICIP